jgi:hypothetical protein
MMLCSNTCCLTTPTMLQVRTTVTQALQRSSCPLLTAQALVTRQAQRAAAHHDAAHHHAEHTCDMHAAAYAKLNLNSGCKANLSQRRRQLACQRMTAIQSWLCNRRRGTP